MTLIRARRAAWEELRLPRGMKEEEKSWNMPLSCFLFAVSSLRREQEEEEEGNVSAHVMVAVCGVFKIYGWRTRKLLHFTRRQQKTTKIRNKKSFPQWDLKRVAWLMLWEPPWWLTFIQIRNNHHHHHSSLFYRVSQVSLLIPIPKVNSCSPNSLASESLFSIIIVN